MARETFDDLTDIYEASIDWTKRLGNEEGFYRALFGRVGAGMVLDTACGTGHHAAMFSSWGLRVEGADISAEMIERCHQRYGESGDLRWVVRGFDQPIDQPGSFDVVVCVGNSLALAGGEAIVAKAIDEMLAGVRSGGAAVVHVLSLWELEDGPMKWQKCLRTNVGGREVLILKGVRRHGDRGFVELAVATLDEDKPALRSESVSFLGLRAEQLEEFARKGGASRVEFYGDYQNALYNAGASQDLIMVAIK